MIETRSLRAGLCLFVMGLVVVGCAAQHRAHPPDSAAPSGNEIAAGRPSTSILPVAATAAPDLAPVLASRPPFLGDDARTDIISLHFDHTIRTARVRLPAELSAAKVPLVLALHGSDGSAADLERLTGYDQIADREGIFVAYADGLAIDLGAGFVSRSWNSGECCEPATSAQVDDVGFLTALIDALIKKYPIDRDQVFVVGHSNGAIMAQLLACRIADRLAAVASVAGSLDDTIGCAPSRPVSFMEMHGTADQNVVWDYGERAISDWRGFDQCGGSNPPVADGTVTTTTWMHCSDDTRVLFISIVGADHPWPSQKTPTSDGLPISYAVDATETTWSFFSSVSREQKALRRG
jgi:polyhydroxybutyrate depolymerase